MSLNKNILVCGSSTQKRKKMKKNNSTPNVNLNLNVRGLGQSATLKINEISNRLRESGKMVYKFGLGQSPFPVPKPVVDELKANAHQKDYLPVRGLPELCRAVAKYYNRTQGIERAPDNVLVGPGSKELMFLLQLVYYGDLVIPTPSWVSYAPQAFIIGRHVKWVRTSFEDNWKLTAEELENLCKDDPERPRIVILNYPSNPSGASYTPAELEEIARIASKYKLVLLSDEIYGELNHSGKHISIARYYPEGTIISGGLSKWCGAGGWRLGIFSFPQSLTWLINAMAAVSSETYTSTSAPIQFAAVRAFEGGIDIERYLWNSRKILSNLSALILEKLNSKNVFVKKPDGAFYLFPDFSFYREKLISRGITNSKIFTAKLLEETGAALLPGSEFGRPEIEFTARLAYVDFDGSKTLAAAEQIPISEKLPDDFFITYTPNIVAGIKTICNWLDSL